MADFIAVDESGAMPGTLGAILYSGDDFDAAVARADQRRALFADPDDAPVGVYRLEIVA